MSWEQVGFVMTYRVRRLDLSAHLKDMRWLENAMRDADMNGAQLAQAIGVSATYVSKIRRGVAGSVDEHKARAMEHALGCAPGSLFAYGSEP